MHGDIAQSQREVTLSRFKDHKFSVLVATDVASRGLDIPNVDLVIQVEPPKDVETYIHRAGRTARAGKAGTCITFWTAKQKMFIQNIERKAGIKFIPIGIPQPKDVIRATSRDTIKQLKTVNDDLLDLFTDAADELIALQDGDSRAALLKALAFISGCHKEKLSERSLLSGQENYVTFQLMMQRTFHGVGLVWNILRRYLPEKISHGIKGMRTLASQNGAVFDVEEKFTEEFQQIFDGESGRRDFEIKKCEQLPDLFEGD
jgi:ATP-dependent RNA helicase DDX21